MRGSPPEYRFPAGHWNLAPLPATTGALPSPGVHSIPVNLSSEDLANFTASASCEVLSTLTVKWLAFWKTVSPCENMPRLHSTSGGLSDTEAKELQVTP